MRHVHLQAVRPPDDREEVDGADDERPGRHPFTRSQLRRHQEGLVDEGEP
jgi:hypothetical protein